MNWELLNPLKYPGVSLGLISHKLLRWLVPYFLIVLFVLNLLLLGGPFFALALSLQGIFYGLAIMGYLWQRGGRPPGIFGGPCAFVTINLAALIGIARFAAGGKAGQWKPVR